MNDKIIASINQIEAAVKDNIITHSTGLIVTESVRKYNALFRSRKNKERSYLIGLLATYLLNRTINEAQFLHLVSVLPKTDAIEGWGIRDELKGRLLEKPIPGPIVTQLAMYGVRHPKESCRNYLPDGRVLSLADVDGPSTSYVRL